MRLWRWLIFAMVLQGLVGCSAALPPSLGASQASAPTGPHVYLIRGFRNWYSRGIDRLADELRDHHLDATSIAEDQWQSLDAALSGGSLPDARLVLIGFSYGADDAIAIARRRQRRGRPVDLLITIDPVTPAAVPPNVRRCFNFYQSNGVWDLLPWLRGIPLHREAGDPQPLTNINLRSHPELLEPNTSHATIAANPRLHGTILQLVLWAAHS